MRLDTLTPQDLDDFHFLSLHQNSKLTALFNTIHCIESQRTNEKVKVKTEKEFILGDSYQLYRIVGGGLIQRWRYYMRECLFMKCGRKQLRRLKSLWFISGAPGPAAPVPDVDLSHLSAEERAMIENVMAKAQQLEQGPPPPAPGTIQGQMGSQRMMRYV